MNFDSNEPVTEELTKELNELVKEICEKETTERDEELIFEMEEMMREGRRNNNYEW